MKHSLVLLILSLFTSTYLLAQDEGRIIQVDRLDKNMGVYIGMGPSFTLGNNIGDYSVGFNVEAGFLKRSNRILSWGTSLSINGYAYDPNTTSENFNNEYTGPNNGGGYDGYVITLEGGDVYIGSIAFTIKLNAVPVRDDSKISFYVFAKPFIAASFRSDVYGSSDYYTSPDHANWTLQVSGIEWGPDDYPVLAAQTDVTGGIYIGPGIEIFPAKKISGFIQASFGYTLPINFISTQSWAESDPGFGGKGGTLESYFDPEFPMVTKGFPSVNIQIGISINF